MLSLFDFILLFLIVLVFSSLYWYWTIPKNLPPGPLGLPFLGSSLDYLNGNTQHLVLMQNIKKYGPIFKLYIANKLVIILGDYDLMHEALVKQGELFNGRPQLNSFVHKKLQHNGISESEGELWKDHRRFAIATFRDFGVGRSILEDHIREETEFLFERFSEHAANGRPFDPHILMVWAGTNITTQLIFGTRFEYDDGEFVKELTALEQRSSGNGVSFLSPFVFSDFLFSIAKLLPSVRQISNEVQDLVDFIERKMDEAIKTYDPEREATNYVHAYLKMASSDKGPQMGFTRTQLHAACHDMLTAGTISTSTTLRWALLYLTHYPHVQEKMFQEIKNQVGTQRLPAYADRLNLPYVEAVIAETFRLGDQLPLGISRRATSDTKLSNYDIPEDALIVPFLHAVFHNPRYYPDPLEFKPERFLDRDMKLIRDPKMIPFQIGKRACLGEPLARMELFLFLAGLIARFRFSFSPNEPSPKLDPLIGFLNTPHPYKICVEARSF